MEKKVIGGLLSSRGAWNDPAFSYNTTIFYIHYIDYYLPLKWNFSFPEETCRKLYTVDLINVTALVSSHPLTRMTPIPNKDPHFHSTQEQKKAIPAPASHRVEEPFILKRVSVVHSPWIVTCLIASFPPLGPIVGLAQWCAGAFTQSLRYHWEAFHHIKSSGDRIEM